MGSVHFGAPRAIIEKIQAVFAITTFVETGTYMGDTTAWAAERFAKVVTIEGSPEFHREARDRYHAKQNIDFRLGASQAVLREVVAQFGDHCALFWLDAHWMPGSFGKDHECPVLAEIAAIRQGSGEHFILIDDARLFLAPPPRPHRATDWPDLAALLGALPATNYTVVYNDVMVSVPPHARRAMQALYQDLATAAALPLPPAATSLSGKIGQRLKRWLPAP